MKRIISTLFGLAVLCLFAEAQAVPATVSFTGRLSTSNGPVTGNVNLVFTLFNQATNGTSMWTETRNNVAANNGLVYVDLGSQTTLDEGVLQNNPLFLEISVGGEILSPRLPLQSVPYSIRSEVANSADTLGTILPGDVVTAVNAGGGITANRTGNTVTLTGTAVSGTAPINVAAGAVSLVTCGANQIYKMSGGAWTCSADGGTTYTPATMGGINIAGTTIGLTTCSNGQVLKATATAGQYACANDNDNDTTYSAFLNGGLTFNGTQIGLMTCSTNQVLKATGAGTWGCATDNDAGGDILGVTTNAGSGLDGGCAAGTCTLTIDPTDFNGATPALQDFDNTVIGSTTTTFVTLTSASLTVPQSGYILAVYDGMFRANSLSSTNTTVFYSLGMTTSSTGTPTTSVVVGQTWGSQSTAYSRTNTSAVFAVAAGTTTIYVRGHVNTTGDNADMYNHNLNLIFVPN